MSMDVSRAAAFRRPAPSRAAVAGAVLATIAALVVAALGLSGHLGGARAAATPPARAASPAGGSGAIVSPALERLAARRPGTHVAVIVQARPGASRADMAQALRAHGAQGVVSVPLIAAATGTLPAREALALARDAGVRAVTLNGKVRSQSIDLGHWTGGTPYPIAVRALEAWARGATGRGVGVAVVDSGVAGDVADFRDGSGASRVRASVVVNPHAATAGDAYGHGTHVAGIIAGNSLRRSFRDPGFARYAGVAPEADLVSVKVSDDQGEATVLDVIYGLQFVVDHAAELGTRVVNLSLQSTEAVAPSEDPLNAAVEAAWLHGLVVVVAAGNRGADAAAMRYAPANDPYVITVGAVDDKGTRSRADDAPAAWSSRGTTADGVAKPELYAPGAHIVSVLAPGSAFERLCPSCVVAGGYFRAGGTSMAAPIVSGIVADVLQKHPTWTPDQVKDVLVRTADTALGVPLVQAAPAVMARTAGPGANQGLTPSPLLDPVTWLIDPARSSWSRSSWSLADGPLVASWARSSWSCTCSRTPAGGIDPARSSWSRSSWSTEWGL